MSRTQILLSASALGLQQTSYEDCPYCGRTSKMGITRGSEGVLYHCFSTACDAKGFIPDTPDYTRKLRTIQPVERRYVGSVRGIPMEVRDFYRNTYDVDVSQDYYDALVTDRVWEVYLTERDDILMPILNADGARVGEVLRKPHEGCPTLEWKRAEGAPKALTMLTPGWERLSWHRRPAQTAGLVIVEDQLSAERIRQAGLDAVALLGNTLSERAAQILGAQGYELILIWLDPDMTSQAFHLNAIYGGLWEHSKVIWSDEDPKDIPWELLRRMLSD